MANQSVIDELVVKLRLDTKDYDKADRDIDKRVSATEKKAQDTDTKRKRREVDQIKRNKENLKSVKDLALGLRTLALTVGGVLGIGSAAGIVGAVVALTGMETGLRRAAVSTGMSNRELQAWGSTARRLGADAQAGQAAIADLAREQKQFNITGTGPTMQAFARMGVRIGPQSNLADVLGQAQAIYRGAQPAQRGQIEANLAAQNVSADLIVMIKSEKDARETFTQSFNESTTENRKALDAVSNAMAGVSNAALDLANSIAVILQPYIDKFADWVSTSATNLSIFADQVTAAGGGWDGFTKVLNEQSPQLAGVLNDIVIALNTMGQAVDIAAYGFQQLGHAFGPLFDWVDRHFGYAMSGGGNANDPHQLRRALGTVGEAVKWAWGSTAGEAERMGPAPIGHILGTAGGAALTPSAAARGGAGASAHGRPGAFGELSQQIMAALTTQYGLSSTEAAAVVANLQAESSLIPSNVNPTSGASGLAQWLSPDRIAAFKKFSGGLMPHQASWQRQIEFMMTDPGELDRMSRAFAGGGTAAQLGVRYSNVFEAPGQQYARLRGAMAQQLAQQFPNAGSAAGPAINISGPVTVQANDPQELVGGIQRLPSVQNYSSGVR